MRIGQGYDCHRFTAGNGLPIGGVWIAHDRGVEAHSDGDVLIHALIDALLGAAALGDIGQHFPDTDPAFKNCSSVDLLMHVSRLLADHGWSIHNIDATVVAERPKLGPHVLSIRTALSSALSLSIGQVSVKAKTNEKMGWIGAGEGLAAIVVVSLVNLVQ